MHTVGFETAIPVSELSQTHTLNCVATGISCLLICFHTIVESVYQFILTVSGKRMCVKRIGLRRVTSVCFSELPKLPIISHYYILHNVHFKSRENFLYL